MSLNISDIINEGRVTLPEAIEHENNNRLKNLAVRLLDSEGGITEDCYTALVDMLPRELAVELNRQVEATDGHFYLPLNHNLQGWKQP